MGRKAETTPEQWEAFIERIMAGERITAVCTEADMPTYQQVYWKRQHDPSFDERLTLAKRLNRTPKYEPSVNGHRANAVDDEHVPEFPEPQGPNPIDLIRRRSERKRFVSEGKAGTLGEPKVGRPLDFDK